MYVLQLVLLAFTVAITQLCTKNIYLHMACKGHAASVDRVVKDKTENHNERLPSTGTG